MAKLRTRKHKVVLSRSAGGDVGITVLLTLLGIFMFLPMVYVISQSLKPLDELWMYPPKFIVMNPTLNNFKDLFTLMNDSWVPFSRYIFNTVFTSVCGTFGHLFIASMCELPINNMSIYYINGKLNKYLCSFSTFSYLPFFCSQLKHVTRHMFNQSP